MLARTDAALVAMMRTQMTGTGRVTLETIHRRIMKDRVNQANRRSRGRYAWPIPARTIGPRWLRRNM